MGRFGHRVDGLKVARARESLGGNGLRVTQAEFARRLGVHVITLNRIENNKARVSLDLLERIADQTGKQRDHFLSDDDDEESDPMVDLFNALRRVVQSEISRERV
jgi:transcriptional regulator with XRE-family HTH domain